jgi:hypothetical protein
MSSQSQAISEINRSTAKSSKTLNVNDIVIGINNQNKNKLGLITSISRDTKHKTYVVRWNDDSVNDCFSRDIERYHGQQILGSNLHSTESNLPNSNLTHNNSPNLLTSASNSSSNRLSTVTQSSK